MKNLPNVWKVPRKASRKNTSKSDISLNGEAGAEEAGDDLIVTPSISDSVQFALSLHLITNDIPLNFDDTRLKKRADKILDWCLRRGLDKPAFRMSKSALTEIFGHQTNETSFILRTVILTKMRGHVKSKQRSSEWKISTGGFKKLWLKRHGSEFDVNLTDALELAAWRKVVSEYGTGPFTYNEPIKGGRRYHELQQMPKKLKSHFYGGFYDYDLSTANVTLISQHAKMLNPELETPRLDSYIANKSSVRHAIGSQFKLDKKDVKEVMQAVFSVAYFDDNDYCGVFRKLGRANLMKFVNHGYLQGLRAEIVECWRTLLPDTWADGVERFRAYEKIEREVIDAISVDLHGCNYLLQHDGFLLLETTPLDIGRVCSNLNARLGYNVTIDEEIL